MTVRPSFFHTRRERVKEGAACSERHPRERQQRHTRPIVPFQPNNGCDLTIKMGIRSMTLICQGSYCRDRADPTLDPTSPPLASENRTFPTDRFRVELPKIWSKLPVIDPYFGQFSGIAMGSFQLVKGEWTQIFPAAYRPGNRGSPHHEGPIWYRDVEKFFGDYSL